MVLLGLKGELFDVLKKHNFNIKKDAKKTLIMEHTDGREVTIKIKFKNE